MRIRAKFVGVAAGLLSVGALAITPASAASVGIAVFTGSTTQLTCTSGPLPAVGCPAGVGVPFVGGSGTFSFSSASALQLPPPANISVCEYVGSNSPTPTGCLVTSSGAYINVVCGTGAVTSGSVSASDSAAGLNVSLNTLVIVFVGGVGIAVAADLPAADAAAVAVVSISPPSGTPSTNGPCVSNFDVVVGSVIAAGL